MSRGGIKLQNKKKSTLQRTGSLSTNLRSHTHCRDIVRGIMWNPNRNLSLFPFVLLKKKKGQNIRKSEFMKGTCVVAHGLTKGPVLFEWSKYCEGDL